MLHLNHNSSDK